MVEIGEKFEEVRYTQKPYTQKDYAKPYTQNLTRKTLHVTRKTFHARRYTLDVVLPQNVTR